MSFPWLLLTCSISTAGKKSRCGGGCSTAPWQQQKSFTTIRDAFKVFELLASRPQRSYRKCKHTASIRRRNGLEFSKLKDANEYLRTVTLDSTTHLTVNGLDIPLAVSDALIKDELGTITDITAVRYNLAGEWFDVPRSEAHMGLPSAQSLLTSVLRRGGDLPSKILETEATIQGSEATLARLHSALNYESPYEAKLKEYEQRLAVIDKELLGKTEEVEELVDAETEELPLAKALSVELESTDSEERTPEEPTEDRSATQVAVDDAPGEALEVPAKQTPRFRRRQFVDRGR